MDQKQKNTPQNNTARILVVDDEARLRESLVDLLVLRGFTVKSARDGIEALRALKREAFDLILLDLKMPDMNGYQVMEILQDQRLPSKIIVVSGDSAMESAIAALRRGAWDFVRKPYEPDEIFKRVDNALDAIRLEEANRDMESRLKRSEQLHRYLINNSPDLIYTLDHSGRFTFVNAAAESMLGMSKHDLIGKHFSTIIHLEDLGKVETLFNERRTGKRATRRMEVRLKQSAREQQLSLAQPFVMAEFNAMGMYELGSNGKNRFIGTYGIVRDITDRKKAEEAIAYQAYHDLLTGLPNRALLLDRIEQATNQAKRSGTQVALMFIDLDNFKFVNDSLGHFAGDKLLQAIAIRLKSCLRAVDTCARLGGDEFVLLLPQINGEGDAAMIAEKILDIFQEKFEIGEHELYASLSIGIALYPGDAEKAEDLIKHADAAMYQTKNLGRNNYKFYRHMADIPRAGGHLSDLRDLRLALDRDQFDVHYQPQVEIQSGRVIGLEALLRWNHPERGLITPATFFRLAEESGLACPIGEWVLSRVCADMATWHADGVLPGRVSINLSAQQIEKDRSDENFLRSLRNFRIHPKMIGIEITENAVMKDMERTTGKLLNLREAGIEIALDDFGTGYSSLGYLQRLPIHLLKVDQCFVRDVTRHPGHMPILSAINAMAKGLMLRLMVEGIETSDQLELLASLGYEEYQGFLFSQPLALDKVSQLLFKQASGNPGLDKTRDSAIS